MAASMSAPLVRRRDHRFYNGMSLLIAAIVFAGFYRTFYLSPWLHGPALSPLRIVHGVAFSAWILLFVTQTTLVAAGGPTFIAGLASRAPCSRWGWSYWAVFWPYGMRARGGRRRASRLASF